jgi:hypothetical protein
MPPGLLSVSTGGIVETAIAVGYFGHLLLTFIDRRSLNFLVEFCQDWLGCKLLKFVNSQGIDY